MPPVKHIDQHAEAAKLPAVEPTIDQVRELLFGQTQRVNEARTQELNQAIDVLRREMLERFAAVDQRMEELTQATTNRHVSTIEAIGTAISDLGAQVRKLVETPSRK